jgi:arabinan endo-1,5-alpha-L-arabinosidase
VLRAADGGYYAYASQHTTVERWARVQVARSEDLIEWEVLGEGMPERPAWSQDTWECAWAPHVVRQGSRYVMFFSAMPDDRTGMWLGVALADDPAGPFRDTGEPLVRTPGFAAIDPMAFEDQPSGRWFLYWGGDRQPIRTQELAPDLTAFVAASQPKAVLEPDPSMPYETVIEGAFLVLREGRYVLFYSGDRFGGEEPRYAVMAARAETPDGPFERLRKGERGRLVLSGNDRWLAPGHNSVITDGGGADWIVYHAIDPQNRWNPGVRFVRRPMLIDPIEWVDGWPVVNAGRGPSSRSDREPVQARGA